MSDTNRKVLITCLIFMVVICLCLSVLAILGAAGVLVFQRNPNLFDIPSNLPAQPSEIPLTDAEIQQEMDEIESQVSTLRGLQPSGPATRALLTSDDLRQHVLDDFLEDYTSEEARNDVLSLASFGLLNPDFNLHQFLLELYSEQIAGFYDHDTKEMYVVQGESFQGPERLTYAHEYQHVLQDQNYDIQNGLNYNEDECEIDTERCAAIQALIEGDASLTELTWFQNHATNQDRQEILSQYQDLESPVYDSAPDFLKEDFLFPYQQGMEFVQSLHDEGGWEAVDGAYRELPASTEQILHPQKYPDDQPETISLPTFESILGSGWQEIDRGVLGEWYTYLVLAHGSHTPSQLEDETAYSAAEGWGGDAYAVYYHEETQRTVMILKTSWDSQSDAKEFAGAFENYATARFDEPTTKEGSTISWSAAGSFTRLHLQGSQTMWLYTPDRETAELLIPLIQEP